jgi:thiosulfate dehydrogenase
MNRSGWPFASPGGLRMKLFLVKEIIFEMNMTRLILAAAFATLACGANASGWPGFSQPFNPHDLPAGELGVSIGRGRELVDHTARLLPDNAGNSLNCSSCHQEGGQKPHAVPFVGVAGVYPDFSSRDGRVISLQDRINDCLMRSLNGNPIPSDSQDMNDFVAYMTYLSRDVPTGRSIEGRGLKAVEEPALPFNPGRGKEVYRARCSRCHSEDGGGLNNIAPPLWGANSYTDGAGMAKVEKAVRFIRWNMPRRTPGILTNQEAWDVAAYIDGQPRPHFVKR